MPQSVKAWRSRFQSACPLRGTTPIQPSATRQRGHFNPRAPCGARLGWIRTHSVGTVFQSACPLRGTTICAARRGQRCIFQSACPLRGTTQLRLQHALLVCISIRVPLAGHDLTDVMRIKGDPQFQSACPLRGTTVAKISKGTRFAFQSACPLRGTTQRAKA